MTTVGQGNFAITPVVGFTLAVGWGGWGESDLVAKIRIFDSHGWEFVGLGLNDGGSWRWALDGLDVRIVLSTRKTYNGGLPFGVVKKVGRTRWPFSPLVTTLGPPTPWFSPGDIGTATLGVFAANFYMAWSFV